MIRIAWLLVRRHRISLLAWILGLLVLVSITAPSYEATYGDPQSRAVLVDQMQSTQGSTVLYGRLPDPGSLGQLFAWETGSYIVILAAVMAVILGIAFTRGEEDSGRLEVVRATGVRPGAPLGAALLVLTLACAAVGGGSAAILTAQSTTIDELTVAGGLAYGAVAFLAALCLGLWAIICAQLRPDARSARSLAFVALAVGFAERVVADFGDGWWAEALQWLTPFGWKTVVAPYTQDRFWALLPLAGLCAVFAGVGVALSRRRELRGSVLGSVAGRARAIRVATPERWAWLSTRSSLIGWAVAILGTAALFGSMADGLVTTIASDPATGDLLRDFGRAPVDPVATYFEFLGSFVALLVMICGTLLTLRWRGEESSGRLVQELATGVRRWRSLLARVLVAAIGSLALLALAGLVMGLIGRAQLAEGEPMAYALSATLGETPGLLAAIAGAALLTAVAPRWAGLIWAVVAWSGFTVFFGALVDLPEWALDLSLLGHPPVGSPGGTPDWAGWIGSLTLGLMGATVVGVGAAALLISRRDLRLG